MILVLINSAEVSLYITPLRICFSLIFSKTGGYFLSSRMILFGIYDLPGIEEGLKGFWDKR
jgi:hypothetical protein